MQRESGQLKDELTAIPGVAAAEVTLRDGAPPLARIWLDGSRDAAEVGDGVRALLGSHVPAAPPRERATRRGGLGRGLDDLITEHPDVVPAHINGGAAKAVPLSGVELERVAVVETTDGVHVEVEDSSGTRRSAAVGPDGSIDAAVVAAMASLLGLPSDVMVRTAEVPVEADGTVIVVTAVAPDGFRRVGAAFVEIGHPWAVACAVSEAFRGR